MEHAPSNAELIFWIAALVITILVLAWSTCHAGSTDRIDDIEAWNRNYSRMQNRRNW